jgi:hypothetical protein
MQDIERAFTLGWSLFCDLVDRSQTSIFEPEARVALKATLKSLGIDFDLARLEQVKKLSPEEGPTQLVPLKNQIGAQILIYKGKQATNAFYLGFDLGLLMAIHDHVLMRVEEPIEEVRRALPPEAELADVPVKMIQPLLDSLDDPRISSEDYYARVVETINAIENYFLVQSRGGRTIFVAMSFDPVLVDVVEAIETAAKNCEFTAWRADKFAYAGDAINDVIYDGLRKADYVVVDLTDARPNVYFEAGYAQALGKNPFYIAKSGTTLAFDVSGYPVLFYTSMKQLREELTQRIQARASIAKVAGVS